MRHCTGCGRRMAECATDGACTTRYEPPRYCSFCGRRLKVLVIPTGWRATCRDHGDVGAGPAPVTATRPPD